MPVLKLVFRRVAFYAYQRPWIRRPLLSLLSRAPWLKSRLFRVVLDTSEHSRFSQDPTSGADLTPYARQIYFDLKAAIKARKE